MRLETLSSINPCHAQTKTRSFKYVDTLHSTSCLTQLVSFQFLRFSKAYFLSCQNGSGDFSCSHPSIYRPESEVYIFFFFFLSPTLTHPLSLTLSHRRPLWQHDVDSHCSIKLAVYIMVCEQAIDKLDAHFTVLRVQDRGRLCYFARTAFTCLAPTLFYI